MNIPATMAKVVLRSEILCILFLLKALRPQEIIPRARQTPAGRRRFHTLSPVHVVHMGTATK